LTSHVNRALGDLTVALPELLVFGQDVAKKGGIYGVTRRLQRRAGAARVFDTLLDEQWILGLAIGAAHLGFVTVPEVQYLAFLHNAGDQVRGEAATLQFFSQAQFDNPFVLRLPSFGYQKGFGGHFHNDDSVAALLDIPGLIVAAPARGDDAAALMRTCVAAARTSGSVCLFLEPIALYTTADLHQPGDGGWLVPYDATQTAELGRARVYGDGAADLLLVAFANTVPMSLRVARRLEHEGIRCRVLDLRWLAPLPLADVARHAAEVGRVLLVDETRKSGAVSQQLYVELREAGFAGPLARVTSKDSFVPLGTAWQHVLLSEAEIEACASAILSR
jgi:2-oxoisovalerate dehydrogenase E1 component